MGGGGSSSSNTQSGTRFPWEFINDASSVLGRPFTTQELMYALPQTTSMFGSGGPAGPTTNPTGPTTQLPGGFTQPPTGVPIPPPNVPGTPFPGGGSPIGTPLPSPGTPTVPGGIGRPDYQAPVDDTTTGTRPQLPGDNPYGGFTQDPRGAPIGTPGAPLPTNPNAGVTLQSLFDALNGQGDVSNVVGTVGQGLVDQALAGNDVDINDIVGAVAQYQQGQRAQAEGGGAQVAQSNYGGGIPDYTWPLPGSQTPQQPGGGTPPAPTPGSGTQPTTGTQQPTAQTGAQGQDQFRVSFDQLIDMLPNRGGNRQDSVDVLQRVLGGAGYSYADMQNMTIDQIEQALVAAKDSGAGEMDAIDNIGLAQVLQQLKAERDVRAGAQAEPRIEPYQPPDVGVQVQEGLNNLGFTDVPNEYVAPSIVRGTPMVAGPEVQAAESGFGQGQQLEDSIYRSIFDPQRQELTRQEGLADRRLSSMLGQAGLASSGTGVGQRMQQSEEFGRRMSQASSNAAQQAAASRYQLEYQQAEADAMREQEARMASAGFDQEAQITNAANILQGNTVDAANYLQAAGLNEQTASQARNDFLQLLGVQQQDLARMDQFALNQFAAMFDTYLQQWSVLAGIGYESTGRQEGET